MIRLAPQCLDISLVIAMPKDVTMNKSFSGIQLQPNPLELASKFSEYLSLGIACCKFKKSMFRPTPYKPRALHCQYSIIWPITNQIYPKIIVGSQINKVHGYH